MCSCLIKPGCLGFRVSTVLSEQTFQFSEPDSLTSLRCLISVPKLTILRLLRLLRRRLRLPRLTFTWLILVNC
jgi:hypothetical protein